MAHGLGNLRQDGLARLLGGNVLDGAGGGAPGIGGSVTAGAAAAGAAGAASSAAQTSSGETNIINMNANRQRVESFMIAP